MAVPLAGAVGMVTVSPPSPSPVSLPSTLMVTGVSSLVEGLSATATGMSFTGVTVMVTVAVAQSPLASHTWYVKVSVPLKSGLGV